MAVARWQRTIVDEAGNVLSGATIEVRREVAGLPLEPLYSDRSGSAGITNPFNADANGFASFHCRGGAFKITATSGAYTASWRYVPIGLAQESDTISPSMFLFSFNSDTADADPGDGFLSIDAATLDLAETLYLSKVGGYGEDLSSVISGYFSSTNTTKARLRLVSLVDRSIVLDAEVEDAITDGGDYFKVALVNVVAPTLAPAPGDAVDLIISPVGDAGLVGSGSLTTVEFDFGSGGVKTLTKSFAVPGVTTAHKVVASVSLDMPLGVSADELEMDMVVVAGAVTAANTVTITAYSLVSPITGKRNINLSIF